ncbi:ABC transporter ATP-binding protein [uncultured Negativibacillus sp.]|uniref:ABC transporter ATP-binding protein n=1 Tax=uncultured Negativibacillus sp. TaxID=1980696 RepID=UPI0025E19781|nr:ABC transporter ATP-binding protein [uncultured Negativibacillus sp.]
MRMLFKYLKPYVPRMTMGVFIKFFGTIMELMIPWILSYILDNVVPTKDRRMIFFWGIMMIACSLAAVVGNILANRVAASVARDTTRSVRHDLFKKISYLSCRQIDYFSIPTLESRLTTDTYNVNQVIGMMQRLGIRAPILLIGGICITMTMEPVLTLVMISVLPFITLVVWLVSRKGIPMYTYLQQGVDILVRTVRENISGIRVIKALSKTEEEKQHFADVNNEVVRRETRATIIMGITNPMMNLLLNVGLTLVIAVGAYRVNAGMTQPGTIIAFLSYFTIILNAMLSVTRMFVMYSRGSASAQRIYEVLNTEEDLQLTNEEAVEEDDHIVFEDVCFSYKGKSDNLSHISFRLKKGETLGIIGPTGAGKTTIINLLMRLYEKKSGSIRIQGRPVGTIPPEELHTKFGVVFQNDVLFADTIHENIDFGRKLPEERIMQAAKCAQAMEFIDGLPEKMDHMVTARGTNLSGGQKQRVLLSRALAGDSEILILDDSSSALDYKTDSMLRQALRENYAGITTIVIAQRVSSILHADHILVLEEGKEIGYGTHEELMESCELYREISESQMGGDFG